MADLDAAAELLYLAENEYEKATGAKPDTDERPRRSRRRERKVTATTTPTERPSVRNRAREGASVANPSVREYPGRDYGYHPGLGWGYYGWDGSFVTGVLIGSMLDDQDTVVVEREPEPAPDPIPDREDAVGGGGDFGDSHSSPRSDFADTPTYTSPDPAPAYDPPDFGGSDFGGGGDSGGGGGDMGGGDSGGGGDF